MLARFGLFSLIIFFTNDSFSLMQISYCVGTLNYLCSVSCRLFCWIYLKQMFLFMFWMLLLILVQFHGSAYCGIIICLPCNAHDACECRILSYLQCHEIGSTSLPRSHDQCPISLELLKHKMWLSIQVMLTTRRLPAKIQFYMYHLWLVSCFFCSA